MSSTLFNRGMNTQVGMRRRAEEVKKSLDELRASAVESKAVQAALDTLTRENAALRALVTGLETRLAGLETKVTAVNTTALEGRLTVLEKKPVPTFDASALEGRLTVLEAKPAPTFDSSTLDARISTLSTDLQAHVTKTENIPERLSSVESRVTGLENRPTA